MQKLKVIQDTETYSAIILAFCMDRRPTEAWWTLRKFMPEDKIRPTASQFATIMTGYIKVKDYKEALNVWNYMQSHSIEPTISTRAIYLRAKALLEDSEAVVVRDANGFPDANQVLGPLSDTVNELLDALKDDPKFGPTSEVGMRNIAPSEAAGALFETLIHLHGQRRCFDAAWELFEMYNARRTTDQTADKTGDGHQNDPTLVPYRVISAMMSVYQNAGQHEEVGNCWDLLFEQAIQSAKATESLLASTPTAPNSSPSSPSPQGRRSSDPPVATPPPAESSDLPRPVPAKRFLLAIPFRYYASSVLTSPTSTPESVSDLIRTLMSLLRAGWALDNITWNILIQRLCAMDPSRAALAFSLTERFLIPQFPGWIYPRHIVLNAQGAPNKSKVAEQVQYINYPRRFIAPTERMPYYKTMVYLAYAVMELRRLNAIGLSTGGSAGKLLKAQVGTMGELEARTPRTLEHVRNLPVVLDDIQRRLIRKGDELLQGGRWFGKV
ncbi:hypothetical protein K461DRAFT_277320 [Myriangium duriaei CBS 260.36]|uniref:Pentatricopeptide repeat domain-containing protein n=1 Tax=Myriangium duriaei CBS 260.36 TaxID=1168546 RepID=A0A9P4J8E1_9PEZI|nr:hypothetical protein K461DRAFT_277320 [Myriangium duriaei CBS 260.36]